MFDVVQNRLMGEQSRTVVITGAGRGIGAATARTLASRGYRVVVNYLSDAESAESVVADIVANGGSAHAVAADVTDPEQVARLVTETVALYGSIDAVVFNANAAQPSFVGIEDLDWASFEKKIVGELAAVYHLTQQILPLFRARGSGAIVYISSTAADFVGPGLVSHGTAKSALNTYAGHIAAHAAAFGVIVTTVAPGAVRTEASAAVLTQERLDAFARTSILGRVTEPDDVARVVALALDPDLTVATGSILRVDGGARLIAGGPVAAR